ncbi:hypothetical protein [Myxococcus xanthus]|uniref:hypothetical protein n=1 Tax=Myxococcus xanthus TaxID=34 RepID=UPI00112AC16C|nr:hypothetical protein [Myxococcus xanthus]QDE83336.1 hypothetical protein BHS07_18205 [Myxococcus xanthus]
MVKFHAEVIDAYGSAPTVRPLGATTAESAKDEAFGLTSGIPRLANGGKVVVWREETGGRSRVGTWGWLGLGLDEFVWSDWDI